MTVNKDFNGIQGRWKVVAANSGVPDNHHNVENGPELMFKKDGTFWSNMHSCQNGKYIVTKDTITLEYTCTDVEETTYRIQKHSYSLKNGILRMKESFLNCFEDCYYDYKKISN
ncbi:MULTISPECIES: hypothetical protein [Sphingobacterium]|uniref:Lipocalin-like domain-containing protein n=1 Tax=Sphingobacterium ginsenosidimutans TaxID=687845 RepID=A0ABP8AD95_9SPHI|nr:hypothetical protein [Sphingobacterium sp. E70]ULT26223.1 hypothetical protein KUH03_04670 [Sphingobacterium sp. E70]